MRLEFQNHIFNLPDFFIVGAPKCGTSALTNYLRQHPQIFIPNRKELHHFATDLYDPGRRQFNKDFFYSFFKESNSDDVVGDASVFHLFSKEAHRNIHSFNPDAKIIIMLRQPTEMLYSYHSQLIFNGDENISDFEEALNAEEERKEGKRIPNNVKFRSMLYYSEIVKYSEQVKRYFETFGEDRVKVIIYDDFKNSTQEVYNAVLQFLNIESTFQPNFKIINPNKVTRFGILRNVYGKKPAFLEAIGRIILPSKRFRKRLLRYLKSVNTKKVDRRKLDPTVKDEITKKYVGEVERLEELISRDLNAWK